MFATPLGASDDGIATRILDEIKDATAFGTGYLRSAEDAENARVDDLADSIASWDRRIEVREVTLRRMYANLETNLAQLQAQSTWLAGQIASLAPPAAAG